MKLVTWRFGTWMAKPSAVIGVVSWHENRKLASLEKPTTAVNVPSHTGPVGDGSVVLVVVLELVVVGGVRPLQQLAGHLTPAFMMIVSMPESCIIPLSVAILSC